MPPLPPTLPNLQSKIQNSRSPISLWALDFDGVICDSARETAAAAWRAGMELWPEWRTQPEPPPPVLDGFCLIRPLLETGWQAIPMLRLLADGLPPAAFRDRFPDLIEKVRQRTGRTVPDLVRLFGAARDRWIAAAPDEWLARHRFYPGVADALRGALRSAQLFILTTKQARFTERLLAAAGAPLPPERIFGLETGRSKDELLISLLARPEHRGLTCAFVEDRLEALERAAARPELAAVRLLFARWGYSGEAEQARAAANPRIRTVDLPAFVRNLSGA